MPNARKLCDVAVESGIRPSSGSVSTVWGCPMVVAVQLDFRGATLEQYDEAMERMGLLSGGPSAREELFHWVTKTDDGFRIIDVWESREAFRAVPRDTNSSGRTRGGRVRTTRNPVLRGPQLLRRWTVEGLSNGRVQKNVLKGRFPAALTSTLAAIWTGIGRLALRLDGAPEKHLQDLGR